MAFGVIFTGYQIYHANIYTKNKNTFELFLNWSQNTEIRIKIKNHTLFKKKEEFDKKHNCFWHYMLITKFDLENRTKYVFYPNEKLDKCMINVSDGNSNDFEELYEMLTDLFNYYETISMAYYTGQYNKELFKEQFKDYLTEEREKFNWLEDFGWERFYPNYTRLINEWSGVKRP